MGTGSSKGRPRRPARRWRAARRGSGAPAGQGRAEGQAAAPADAPGGQGDPEPPRDPSPPPPPGEPESDAELLDQVLAECRAGCEDDEGDRRRLWPRPQRPPRLDAGDSWPRPAGGDGGEGGSPRDPQVFLPRSTPESSNFANQHSLKKPERQAKIAYDYSEEELMATIEQEYCR